MNRFPVLLTSAASLLLAAGSQAQDATPPVITVGGVSYQTWDDYKQSLQFQELGLRCSAKFLGSPLMAESQSDCSSGSTTPRPEYEPRTLIEIPVVVHIIQSTSGQGQISDNMVNSQIDILNEDFRAIAGTNGANGTDTMIQFYLARTDPNGNPTTGITRSTNNTWFNDGGSYWNSLAWDTSRYLNIYTNSASGALGYVPSLPQGGIVGATSDRVVVLWSAFGLNAPIGFPFNLGRTATHEVGHYFGLYHTFSGGCGSGNCYTSGDRICDTNAESFPTSGCPGSKITCGNQDPVDNYMDYSDDFCMEMFTDEQTNRMRCTIENWRPDLPCRQGGIVNRVGGGTNLDSSYSCSDPIIGQQINIAIDGTGSGYNSMLMLGYAGPATLNFNQGQVMLVDLSTPNVFTVAIPGLTANFSLNIPYRLEFCGAQVYTQIAYIGGAPNFVLSNAQDWTIGL